MSKRFAVRPVTSARWEDFAGLFSSKGCPHYCWCTVYREPHHPEMTPAQRRGAMRRRVKASVPVGVLAYDGDEPVGWCSVAPRETYARLERSRTMPRLDDAPTWTVLCFFVRRDHRGLEVPRRLLEGAAEYGFAQGADVIEGYPYDSAGISSTHRGHSSVFRAAGFKAEGKRWVRRRG